MQNVQDTVYYSRASKIMIMMLKEKNIGYKLGSSSASLFAAIFLFLKETSDDSELMNIIESGERAYTTHLKYVETKLSHLMLDLSRYPKQ